MFWNSSLTTAAAAAVLVLASRACAEIRPLSSDSVIHVRSADVLDRHYAEVADRYLSKRQAVDPDSEVPLSEDEGMNMEAWDQETAVACAEALAKLDIPSNPSGTGICYNLPSLDTNSGIFEADLRLFKLSEPFGSFAGIPPQDIEVGLGFSSAEVSPVESNRISGYGMQRKRAENIELLQTYMFVGRIESSRMDKSNMSMAELEALVMPILTLTANSSNGETVSTIVSSNEAAFLTGVFSKEVVMSDFATALQAVQNVTAELSNGDVAFVLPGVQIMIFPIGMVITGIWMVLGFIAYGFGTYERMSYAESFRRRSAIAGGSKGTI